MADSAEPTMSGGQQPGTNEGQASLQAGTEAVELKTLPVTESSSIPGGPVPDPDAISPAGPSVSTAPHVAPITIPDSGLAVPPAPPSPKGKEKEEPQRSSLAIEPSDDLPPASPVASGDAAVCIITLLLATGARHPYRLDEKYLTKRGVEVPGMTEAGRKDPFSVSVYTLKELILREWRDEWEVKPSSPTSIRLIYFGKLLDDKMQLKEYQFSKDTANVVHMSVRPQEMVDEEEAAKGKGSGGVRGRSGGGGCCVIL